MRTGGILGVVAASLGLLFPLQSSIDARRPKRPSSLLYTPDKRLMRVVACGHGPTLAELVWVQSNNYVIDQFKLGKTHIQHLYALYDTITELDPNAVDAYVLGAVFLSSVAQQPDESLRLLQKGQGALIETKDGKFVEDPSIPGRVNPRHPERWKLLHEYAATYLVCYASGAVTADERQEEIRRAGRLYQFGFQRYPVASYPTVPDWFAAMGQSLANRHIDTLERAQYREAVNYLIGLKIRAAGPDSPLLPIYRRTLEEIDARGRLEDLNLALDAWRKAHPGQTPLLVQELAKPTGPLDAIPADPLGVGFYLVDGRIVAPALDAAKVQRDYERAAREFERLHDRWPLSLEELGTELARRQLAAPVVPPWVTTYYDPLTGEVKATGRIPAH